MADPRIAAVTAKLQICFGPFAESQAEWVATMLLDAADAATWQPIEAAPQPPLSDTGPGRYIIGYCPLEHEHDRVRVIWWEPNLHGGMWQDDRELDKFGGPKPTRWQPMLSPPKDSTP